MRIENKLLTDSCSRATRENSWRQQLRELRQPQKDTHTPQKQEWTDEKYAKRGCQQRTI